MPRLAPAAALLLAVVGLPLAVLWLGQRKLLYFPAREDRGRAEARARALGLEPWPAAGELFGWRVRHPEARGTVLVLHGNAGSALDRAYAAAMVRGAGVPADVVLLEYPGYGARPGTPGQAAFVAAARRAVAAVRAERPGPVYLLGESLGSAVAALVAAEAPAEVAGLLLVTPLASVPAVARRHYGPFPDWFFRDPLRADRALPRYGGRVVFVLAGRDEVTFADLGQALFAEYPGPKRLFVEAEATHNTVDWGPGRPPWGDAFAFLAGRG